VIEKAVLTCTVEEAIVKNNAGNPRGVPTGPNATNCVGPVLESSRNIFTGGGSYLPGYSHRVGQGDVTGLVTTWVVNQEPNHGFVLVGLDESFPRNNAACINYITCASIF
jgi:hypothetical protein